MAEFQAAMWQIYRLDNPFLRWNKKTKDWEPNGEFKADTTYGSEERLSVPFPEPLVCGWLPAGTKASLSM